MPKPTQKSLEDELDFCHDLMQRTFAITIEKPQVYYGGEHLSKFYKIKSKWDRFMAPKLTFSYKPKFGIYVGRAAEYQESYERAFGWLGMLADVFIEANSPELCKENYDKLRENEPQKAGANVIVTRGISDYMAINCCKASGDPKISNQGTDKERELNDILQRFIGSSQMASKAMLYETDGWKLTVLQYMEQNPNLITISGFEGPMGQHFMKHFENPNLKQLLANPPRTMEEIVYPARYVTRVAAERGIKIVK